MLLTILLTVFLCAIVQISINNADKYLKLLGKYVPFLNKLLPKYAFIEPEKQKLESVFSSAKPDLLDTSDMSAMINNLLSKKDKPVDSFDTLLKDYETKNSTKVIFINHAKKSGMYGISLLDSEESLTMADSKKFVDIMREISPETNITLILNTPGGSLSAAEIIIHTLINHQGKIFTYIPYSSMSAGTIITLASDEIYMDKNAYCGPIDPQIGYFSANDIIKYCDDYASGTSIISDIVKLMVKKANTALERVKGILHTIYTTKNQTYDLNKIYDELLIGKHNHDRPLFVEKMTNILPNVKVGIPNDVMELYNAFVKTSCH